MACNRGTDAPPQQKYPPAPPKEENGTLLSLKILPPLPPATNFLNFLPLPFPPWS